MAKTKTQKEFLLEIRKVVEDYGTPEQVEFIDGRISALEKKGASKGMTEQQKKNEETKKVIIDYLTEKNAFVPVKELEEVTGENNWRVTALLTQLRESKQVTRKVEKKKAYYGLYNEMEEEN